MKRNAGRAVRHFRERAGLTIKGLAKESRVPYGTLQTWESNPERLNPNNKKHQKIVADIASVLGVEPDAIWLYNPAEADLLEERLQRFLLSVSLDRQVSKDLRDQARALLSALLS